MLRYCASKGMIFPLPSPLMRSLKKIHSWPGVVFLLFFLHDLAKNVNNVNDGESM